MLTKTVDRHYNAIHTAINLGCSALVGPVPPAVGQ